MPRSKVNKPNISRHGTLEGQQTKIENYKKKENYKILRIKNDALSLNIKNIYEENIWNLKSKFSELKEHMEELGNTGTIAWENDIQYLDFPRQIPNNLNKISLKSLKEGKYVSRYTDKKPNLITTDETYANRIIFLTNEIKNLNKFKGQDELKWIIKNNRLLIYEVLKYHNDKGNTISTINRDFKALVRVIKLVMNEENELRFKFSALQIAFTDLENISDDLNKIKSKHEIKNFIPYEQLLDICDKLEKEYNDEINKLPLNIRNNGTKHPPNLFHKHQILLAMSLNVWDYPSRLEKYKMDIISNENNAETNKNYILISEKNSHDCIIKMIMNEVVKEHKPIQYILKSTMMKQFNNRLCNLLRYSIKTYPRPHLFVNKEAYIKNNMKKVAPATVSKWLGEINNDRKIGIDMFRSAFVSYYFPKVNNRQRQIMRLRMRTSMDVMMRSYLKFYNNPDDLVKIKIEPTNELKERVKKGTEDNPIIIPNTENDDQKINIPSNIPEENIEQEHIENPEQILPNEKNPRRKSERNRVNFRKWYNNDENKEKKKTILKDPKTYARRYVRELNIGKIEFDKMNEITIEKYKIKINDNDEYYSELLYNEP